MSNEEEYPELNYDRDTLVPEVFSSLKPIGPIIPFVAIKEDDDTKTVVKANLVITNAMLAATCAAWDQVQKLSDLPKLIMATTYLLEKRTQLALKPTHAADRKNPAAFGYDPID